MRISIEEIQETNHRLDIRAFEDQLRAVQRAILQFTQLRSYQGQTATQMKAYYNEVHGAVLRGFLSVLEEYERSINRLLQSFHENIDPSPDARIDLDYLTHMKTIVHDYRQRMLEVHQETVTQVNRARHIVDGLKSPPIEELDWEARNAKRNLDHTIDQVVAFNNHHNGATSLLEQLLGSLENVLNNMGTAITSGGVNYQLGDFANTSWGKELNQLVSLQNFLANLPPHLRKIFENLKGIPPCNAFTGDPVNTATGNFIYDYTDLEIKGRTPLAFRRFYNSVEDYNGRIGRNWSHNYDIRTFPDEERGVNIRFDDGHQEYYSYRKETGTYHSPKDKFTILTRTEDGGYLLTFPNQSSFHFDEKGFLTVQQYQNGSKINFIYEEDRLVQVASESGSLNFTYDNERIVKLIDGTGREVAFTYGSEGVLLTATGVRGYTHEYDYDENFRLNRVINPEGIVFLENQYDENDRIVEQRFADEGVMKYHYHDGKKETEFIQQNGAPIVYKRDDEYRTVGIVHLDGEERFEYNRMNQRTATIDKMGNRTEVCYDEKGNVQSITNPLGIKTEFTYTEDNQLTSLLIAGEKKVENTYDEEGNLLTITDALGNQASLSYQEKGTPQTLIQPDGSEIHLSYDDRKNITKIVDAFGGVTQYQYDSLNRVIHTIDANGHETHSKYDNKNNLIEVKNALGKSQSYTYNRINKVVSVTDFDGSRIKREYNSLGKPSKVIDQLGRETSLNYDAMWNLAHVIEPNGAETHFRYNQLNRLETIEKADKSTNHYEYDPNGNRTGVTDEAGNETRFVYDALNQLVEVRGTEGLRIRYAYD